MSLAGWWRIVEMELWAQEDVDLVGPAFLEFGGNGIGSFAFIAVEGQIDFRNARRDGRAGVEFSWEGWDDSDRRSGRGWAALAEDGSLRGRIHFHLGDDSSFRAERIAEDPRAKVTSRTPAQRS